MLLGKIACGRDVTAPLDVVHPRAARIARDLQCRGAENLVYILPNAQVQDNLACYAY
jgi:hypothetical protein